MVVTLWKFLNGATGHKLYEWKHLSLRSVQAKTLNKFDTVCVVVNDGYRDLRQGIIAEVLGDGSNTIVTIAVGNHEIKLSGGTKYSWCLPANPHPLTPAPNSTTSPLTHET